MAQKFIDTLDDQTLDAEQSSFGGGVDEFIAPHRLPDGVAGRLINVLVEDSGRPRPRAGADALGGSVLSAAKTLKALCYFDTPANEYLFASLDASLRRWDRTTWSTIAAYPFGAASIIEMAQGNNLLYLSDGAVNWRSLDPATSAWTDLGADNATATGDPPVGASIMCWHTNRMFANAPTASVSDQIAASDLGAAGANSWKWTKFSFRVGRGEGQAITSMVSGKGFWLMVGKEASIYAVNTEPTAVDSTNELSAAAWAVKRVSAAVGVLGKRAMCMFGDECMVFCRDGLRAITETDFPDTPFELSPPLSQPIQPWVDRVNWSAAGGTVLIKHRHYLFCFVPLDGATANSHVFVWNGRSRTWAGVFTGWPGSCAEVSRFGADGERLNFGDTAGQVNVWKDYASDSDSTFTDNGAVVLPIMRCRSMDFGTQRNWKDGAAIEAQFVNSRGLVDIVAVYDGEERQVWTENFGAGTTGLVLPFTLPQTLGLGTSIGRTTRITKSLDHLGEFKEMYVEIRPQGKRVEVKSVSVEAYLNTVDTE